MKHIVCFSGGHSSALVAIEVARKYGAENVILLNHDITSRVEDRDIKRFKIEVAAFLGIPITYANHKDWATKTPTDICIAEQAFQGKAGQTICTNRLKTKPFEKFLDTHHPEKDCIIYYGFDKGEVVRIQRRSSHLGGMGYKTDYPLALWEERTITSTREIGIEPPMTYGRFKRVQADARHERFKVGGLHIWYPWRGVPYKTSFGQKIEVFK